MSNPTVLVIDDEPDIRELLELTLGKMDIECVSAKDLKEAYQLIDAHSYFLCLADMRLPDGDGIEFVNFIQQNKPELPIAVITAFGNVEGAVNTLKAGAFDYVSKPVNLQILRDLVNTALSLSKDQQFQQSNDVLIGDSKVMQQLRDTIKKLARSQAPVFINGESGSGKELVARQIHIQGARHDKPFIPVNCGAIPTELMESEFFGHKKGSFTGAVQDKQGLFQAAHGGTLFLDEIAELPLNMQVKLLRAIQEKAIKPIGEQNEVSVDVRILSASHKDLNSEIQKGDFRQDLYYRINVIDLQVPSLREHLEDIPLISQVLALKIANTHGLTPPVISKKCMHDLMGYDYPGNVRELENILERAITLSDQEVIESIDLPHFTEQDHSKAEPKDNMHSLDTYLDQKERELILDALDKTRWNRTAAAKLLGLSFRALRYRLKKLGIE